MIIRDDNDFLNKIAEFKNKLIKKYNFINTKYFEYLKIIENKFNTNKECSLYDVTDILYKVNNIEDIKDRSYFLDIIKDLINAKITTNNSVVDLIDALHNINNISIEKIKLGYLNIIKEDIDIFRAEYTINEIINIIKDINNIQNKKILIEFLNIFKNKININEKYIESDFILLLQTIDNIKIEQFRNKYLNFIRDNVKFEIITKNDFVYFISQMEDQRNANIKWLLLEIIKKSYNKKIINFEINCLDDFLCIKNIEYSICRINNKEMRENLLRLLQDNISKYQNNFCIKNLTEFEYFLNYTNDISSMHNGIIKKQCINIINNNFKIESIYRFNSLINILNKNEHTQGINSIINNNIIKKQINFSINDVEDFNCLIKTISNIYKISNITIKNIFLDTVNDSINYINNITIYSIYSFVHMMMNIYEIDDNTIMEDILKIVPEKINLKINSIEKFEIFTKIVDEINNREIRKKYLQSFLKETNFIIQYLSDFRYFVNILSEAQDKEIKDKLLKIDMQKINFNITNINDFEYFMGIINNVCNIKDDKIQEKCLKIIDNITFIIDSQISTVKYVISSINDIKNEYVKNKLLNNIKDDNIKTNIDSMYDMNFFAEIIKILNNKTFEQVKSTFLNIISKVIEKNVSFIVKNMYDLKYFINIVSSLDKIQDVEIKKKYLHIINNIKFIINNVNMFKNIITINKILLNKNNESLKISLRRMDFSIENVYYFKNFVDIFNKIDNEETKNEYLKTILENMKFTINSVTSFKCFLDVINNIQDQQNKDIFIKNISKKITFTIDDIYDFEFFVQYICQIHNIKIRTKILNIVEMLFADGKIYFNFNNFKYFGSIIEIINNISYKDNQDIKNKIIHIVELQIIKALNQDKVFGFDDKTVQVIFEKINSKQIKDAIINNGFLLNETLYTLDLNKPLLVLQNILERQKVSNDLIDKTCYAIAIDNSNQVYNFLRKLSVAELYYIRNTFFVLDDNYNFFCKKIFYCKNLNKTNCTNTLESILNYFYTQNNINYNGSDFCNMLEKIWLEKTMHLFPKHIKNIINYYDNKNQNNIVNFEEKYNDNFIKNRQFTMLFKVFKGFYDDNEINIKLKNNEIDSLIKRIDKYIFDKQKYINIEEKVKEINNNIKTGITKLVEEYLSDKDGKKICTRMNNFINNDIYLIKGFKKEYVVKDYLKDILGKETFDYFIENIKEKKTIEYNNKI